MTEPVVIVPERRYQVNFLWGFALGSFDLGAIKEASYANGWQFAGDQGVKGSEIQ